MLTTVAKPGATKYAKYPVFGTFEADFALKTKIAPHPMIFGMRLGEEPDMIWTRKTGSQLG